VLGISLPIAYPFINRRVRIYFESSIGMLGDVPASESIVSQIDTSLYLNNAIKNNKNILFEGAQGAMLSIESGTYPYVTSSSPLANSIPLNAGIPTKAINKVIGIAKAYTTRVGEGPFVTELDNELGDEIRIKGNEFGTVTHRPRRVGYLDLVVLKHSCSISGVDYISLMLLDVLSSIKELKVCTAYQLDGKTIDYIPSTIAELNRCKPVYIDLPSWNIDISNIKKYSDLPTNCKKYIEFIEDYLSIKIAFISVGPDRTQTIIKEEII